MQRDQAAKISRFALSTKNEKHTSLTSYIPSSNPTCCPSKLFHQHHCAMCCIAAVLKVSGPLN